MAELYNRARESTSTTGTGTITLAGAVSDKFLSFSEAGVQDQDTVTYCIEEGEDFEIGRGTYTATGTTLSRDTVLNSKIGGTAGTSKMNLGGNAEAYIDIARDDLKNLHATTIELGHASDTTLSRSAAGVVAVEGVEIGRVGEVATLSDLKALSANQYDVVISQGYTSAGDGGGGVWRWDGSDLSTEVSSDTQNGIYVPPDSDATGASGALVRLGKHETELRWYGGIQTSPDDSSTALQRAIDRATSDNGLVYLPSGEFVVGDVDLKGVSLVGTGKTTLKLLSGASSLFDDDDAVSLFLKGLLLDGDGNSGRAFELEQNRDVTLLDVSFANWSDRVAIFEQGTSEIKIRGGTVRDLTSPDVFVIKGARCSVIGTSFRNCDNHVIRYGRFSGDTDQISGAEGVVQGCIFEDILSDPVLFELDARNGTVVGNAYSNCRNIMKADPDSGNGGADTASRIVVKGNVFRGHVGSNTFVVNAGGVPGMIVDGNMIEDAHGGISVGADSVVSSNVLDNLDHRGVAVDGADSKVLGNTLTGIGEEGVRSTGARCNISNNNIEAASDWGINAAAARQIIMGNDVAGGDPGGIELTSSADDSIAVYNQLNRTTGTKLNDNSTGSTTTPNHT